MSKKPVNEKPVKKTKITKDQNSKEQRALLKICLHRGLGQRLTVARIKLFRFIEVSVIIGSCS